MEINDNMRMEKLKDLVIDYAYENKKICPKWE
jgi:hypothetical protein